MQSRRGAVVPRVADRKGIGMLAAELEMLDAEEPDEDTWTNL